MPHTVCHWPLMGTFCALLIIFFQLWPNIVYHVNKLFDLSASVARLTHNWVWGTGLLFVLTLKFNLSAIMGPNSVLSVQMVFFTLIVWKCGVAGPQGVGVRGTNAF